MLLPHWPPVGYNDSGYFHWPRNIECDSANDNEIEFHEIRSHFFQEIERTIMRLKVIFFRRFNFDLLIAAFFMRSKVKNNAF